MDAITKKWQRLPNTIRAVLKLAFVYMLYLVTFKLAVCIPWKTLIPYLYMPDTNASLWLIQEIILALFILMFLICDKHERQWAISIKKISFYDICFTSFIALVIAIFDVFIIDIFGADTTREGMYAQYDIVSACVMWFLGVLVAPFLEEILCRGLMLRGIVKPESKKITVFIVIILSSLIFMYEHSYEVSGSISTFVAGVVFSVMYLWYKDNILAPIFLHVINNAIASTNLIQIVFMNMGQSEEIAYNNAIGIMEKLFYVWFILAILWVFMLIYKLIRWLYTKI